MKNLVIGALIVVAVVALVLRIGLLTAAAVAWTAAAVACAAYVAVFDGGK